MGGFNGADIKYSNTTINTSDFGVAAEGEEITVCGQTEEVLKEIKRYAEETIWVDKLVDKTKEQALYDKLEKTFLSENNDNERAKVLAYEIMGV